MAEIKKKKLVLKKKTKGGSIADKIIKKKKEEVEARVAKENAKKNAILQVEKEQELEKHKKAKKATVKVQTAEEVKQDEEKKKNVNFTPKTIFIEAGAERKKTTEAARSTSFRTGKKDKSKLREDVLRKEAHKKFFLKPKSDNRRKGGIGGARPAVDALASVPKEIKITEYIQVGELARKLNLKSSDIISKLMRMGTMATITQSIDADTAAVVAEEYGCKIKLVSLYDETVIQEVVDKDEDLVHRPPVVTIMGHVDHGKTKLLDALRSTDVVGVEAGGITQHIGAYQITVKSGDKITFLDTPGHEAFTAMRARGANITDIVVLVVAADDGVMPQTVEAIHHAKDAKVPIIVAINKIDKEGANVEKIRQDLSQYELVSEEWGGDTPFIEVSALKKLNLDKLIELILATAEVLDLKANPNKDAVGTVVEARLDQGRGAVATILIQSGTLKIGNPYVAGLEGGRVRALFDDRGLKIKEAGPAMPIEILGLTGVPHAGDPFHAMNTDKDAKTIVEKRQELNRQEQAQKIKKVKLENLNEVIKEGNITEFKVIIKADVRGSVEALESSLVKLTSDEIKINVVMGGTGEINESDVMLASAAGAIIVGFNTRANAKVKGIASKESVEIRYYSIIYQVIDDVKIAISGMLAPDVSEKIMGDLEIRQVFKVSSVGNIGGAMVTSGIIKKSDPIRLVREGVVIYTGKLKSLKRFKDDTNEVKEGFECGVVIEGYNDIKEGDVVESYTHVETSRKIDDVLKENKEKQAKKEAEEVPRE